MNLRDYQQRAVEWAKSNHGIIVAPAGSGKTWIAAEIIKHQFRNGLKRFGWIAPTRETCQQAESALKFAGLMPGIVEIRCPHESVNFSDKQVLIVDECFPGHVMIGNKRIEDLKAGDLVDSYNHDRNTIEKKRIVEVFSRPAPKTMVTVLTTLGPIECTPNHPFWNGEKYVAAESLTCGDFLFSIPTHERGLQILRNENSEDGALFKQQETCLSDLQSEQSSQESENCFNEMLQLQCGGDLLQEKQVIPESGSFKKGKGLLFGNLQGHSCFQDEFKKDVGNKLENGFKNSSLDAKSNCFGSNKDENISIIEVDWASSINSRRQWNRDYSPSAYFGGKNRFDSGVCDKNKWLRGGKCSELLQGGFSVSRCSFGSRSGWSNALFTNSQKKGSEKNESLGMVRVVSVKIHKQGSAEWYRCLRGKNIVYNFHVEENENYFANGILVHNCKHSSAVTWARIIQSCSGLKYGFDATPWSDTDTERNAFTKQLFGGKVYIIRREEIGDSLADAYLEMSHATDSGLKIRIDDNIERLFNARRRYMRISDQDLEKMCAWESLIDIGICQNRARNDHAINVANQNPADQRLVLIPRVTLGEEYEKRIPGSRLVHSKMPKKARRTLMEEFRAGNLKAMIATSLADEGLDLPNAELLIMVSGGRSSQKTIQRASRALRKTDRKQSATIVDFWDRFHPIGEFHARKRVACYKQLGCVFL